MRKVFAALAAWLVLFAFATQSNAGFGTNATDCTTATGSGAVGIAPREVRVYCPNSTVGTTAFLAVQSFADCNWNADTTSSTAGIVSGQATLTATKCSGQTTAASDCKNVLTDTNSNTTITSGDPTGSFTLASGTWLVTASAAAANGRLVCTGR